MLQRARRAQRATSDGEYIVTEDDLKNISDLVRRCNEIDGPSVEWDHERGCYGLRARRNYARGEIVTTYGGKKYTREVEGDYVAKASSDLHIDGRVGFKLSEKGRWINEYDRDRIIVNVTLGRNVRATMDIAAGDWIFTDYGPEYERTY
jgi:hypothetical protein